MFKAKFFSNCSILDDDVKVSGSYAWQSILKAREVVKRGSIWRIGYGRQARIRGDKWLPDKFSSRVISPQKNLPNNALVFASIDEITLAGMKDECYPNSFPMRPEPFLGFLSAHVRSLTNSSGQVQNLASIRQRVLINCSLELLLLDHQTHQLTAASGSKFGSWKFQIKLNILFGEHAANPSLQRKICLPRK